MSCKLLGTLLLLLPGGASAEGRQVQQSPEQLWVLPGQAAELSCHISGYHSAVNWYKEKPDGGLYWIYRSSNYSSPSGSYSGRAKTRHNFSLTINSTRREDSGVYYCSFSGFSPQFGDGTRLVVTDATEPELSILVPVDTEEPGQPPADIPLLCHLHDVPRGWDTVSWQPGEEVASVTALDERGVLNAWSIARVSAELWDGAAVCTATESGTGRTLSVSTGKGPGEDGCPSWPLALGLCCLLLFLLFVTILLWRRRLVRGDPHHSPAPPSPPPAAHQ